MPKRKPRITRLGLPVKSDRIIIAVTEAEKAEIREAARRRNATVSAHLLAAHRASAGAIIEKVLSDRIGQLEKQSREGTEKERRQAESLLQVIREELEREERRRAKKGEKR